MAIDHPHPKPQQGDPYRQLRIISICSLVPALALLLPCGIISGKALPVVGVIPMFFSSVYQIMTFVAKRPRMPKTSVVINLLLAASLFAVLLPSWIFMAERRLKHWDGSDFTMLGAYGTMPMMMNFVIHIYLALRAFLTIEWTQRSGSGCCCNNPNGCLRADRGEISISREDGDESQQPILKFYDESARPSSEFQTSGFNTPRVSQDTLGDSPRKTGDLV